MDRLNLRPDQQELVNNRADRRQWAKHKRSVEPDFMANLAKDYTEYRKVSDDRNEFIKAVSGEEVAEVVFQDRFSYPTFVDSIRTFGRCLRVAQESPIPDLGDPKYPPEAKKYIQNAATIDLYSFSEGRVSLADIENMPLPLARQDIGRITGLMFNYFIFRPKTWQGRIIQDVITFTPLQAQVAAEKRVALPDSATKLIDRFTGFYDYYSDLILSSTLRYFDESLVLATVDSMGARFSQALGLYIPISLGISPSSAAKLYEARGTTMAEGSRNRYVWETYLRPPLLRGVKGLESFRLHPQLGEFQRLQPVMDEVATALLRQHHYGESNTTTEPTFMERENLTDRLNKYRKAILSEIKRSTDHLLRQKGVDSESPIKEILVTSFSGKTLTFIAMLGENGTHLTLDIDYEGNVFGIPPGLSSEFPHIQDLLTRDIISPVLSTLFDRYANLEQSRKISPISQTLIPELKPSQVDPTQVTELPEEEIVKPKKRRTMLDRLTGEVVLPEETLAPQKPGVKIQHNRKLIRELLGKVPERDVDRVMDVIARLEIGGGRIKTLEDVDGLCGVRVGNRRLILEPLGGKTYSVFGIENKGQITKSVYKKLRR